jgi:peptidoglycan/LPS O-acetylase OafA/YrhL
MRESSAEGYVPSLDGLRAASILLVIVAHLGLDGVVPGGFGVTLFFFISGYLLTGQMAGEFARTGRIGFASFYLRRALRLMPAALAFIVVGGGAFVALGGRISVPGWIAAVLYGANYYDLYATYDTTIPPVRHPFIILWSLAVEEHFYIVWPLALAVLLRRRHRALAALLAVCAAEIAWRAALFHRCSGLHPGGGCGLRHGYRLYKATDTRLDSIAWGAIVALLAADPTCTWFRGAVGSRAVQALAATLLLATFLVRGEQFREVERYAIQGLALAVLVPGLIWVDSPARRAFEAAPLVFVGRISYALYLWHWAALGAADYAMPGGGAAWVATAVGLTACLSLSCWHLIERPMLRLRRRAGSHVPLQALRPADGMALGAVGVPGGG